MDQRQLFVRLLRKEFGNLLNAARIKVVTVDSVDYPNARAVINFAQGDAADPVPDQQTVPWLDSMFPVAGQLAYLLLTEGSPVLLGAVDSDTWTNLTLPTGYTTVSPFRQPAYRMDNQGRVWFKGACNVAANNVAGTKFTMPASYRPTSKTFIAVPYSNGTNIQDHMRYDVNTDGTIVTLVALGAATQIFSFEGVSYDTRP